MSDELMRLAKSVWERHFPPHVPLPPGVVYPTDDVHRWIGEQVLGPAMGRKRGTRYPQSRSSGEEST